MSSLRAVLPAVFGEDNRSFAVHYVAERNLLCTFGRHSGTFVVAGHDGYSRLCEVDPDGAGTCREVSSARIAVA